MPTSPTWPTWSDWLKAADAAEVETTRGVWFYQMSMAIHAAAQGQGVALTSLAIAADELAPGRLIAPFTTSVPTPFGYYFLSGRIRPLRRASRRCGISRRRGGDVDKMNHV